MKMKNRNYIGCWLFVISYWLFANHSPYSMFHLSNSAAAVGKTTSQSSLADTTDPNSQFKRRLWLAEFNMTEGEKDKITKNELRRIIEQIRSVNFELTKETFEPAVVPDVVPKDEPDEDVSEGVKEQHKKEEGPGLPYGLVSNKTLQTIRNLSKNPDNLNNPFELGETLFLSGYLNEAEIFYREALKRKSPDDAGSTRAWILFQIGNCLQDHDRPTAIRMYGRLITEYPDSTWKELAEVWRSLLDWYLKEEPHKLIKEHKR